MPHQQSSFAYNRAGFGVEDDEEERKNERKKERKKEREKEKEGRYDDEDTLVIFLFSRALSL